MTAFKSVFRPKKGNVIFSVKDRWIKLFGLINQATVLWFAKFVHATNVANYRPIRVFIDSPGGDTNATLVIHAMLSSSIAPVITVVDRKARSGAFIIFQAGRKRMMFCDSQLVFHWSEFDIKKKCTFNVNNLRAMVKNLSVTNECLYRIIEARTELSAETVKKFFTEGKVLAAKEAKKFNLADEIIKKRKVRNRKVAG